MGKNTIDYWLNQGFDYDDALDMASEFADNTSITAIQIKHKCSLDEARQIREEISAKTRKTREEKGLSTPLKDKSRKERYYQEVWRLTEQNYKLYYDIINPNNYIRSTPHLMTEGNSDIYALDHKYAIAEGFRNNVGVDVIASPVNLEMLPYKVNNSKSDKCSITIEQLIEDYREFEKRL